MHVINELSPVISRLEGLESRVQRVEDKLDICIEQGSLTHEKCDELQYKLSEQHNALSTLTKSFRDRNTLFQRILYGGSVIVGILLLWLMMSI
jgi:hypothetical protein